LSVIEDLKESIKQPDFGLEDLHQYTQLLNDVVRKNTDLAGKINPDGFKATQALNQIDTTVKGLRPKYLVQSGDPNAPKILEEAKKLWGTGSKFERISNIAEKADGDANKIKSLVKNFVSNKKNLRGFSSEEIKALKKASKNSAGEGISKMVGKFGLDFGTSSTSGNTALPILGAAAAGFQGGYQTGGATIAIGTAARYAQKYLAKGKLDDALKIIQSSGNPSQVISKIPNRKIQEKLLNQLFVKGGAAVLSESNN
jgi:hypothetical protein